MPVYNNAGSLALLHERLLSALAPMASAFQIIYVNDGSTDDSYELLLGLGEVGENIKILDMVRNYGQSAAILAAFTVADGEFIVTIDADLENHPEDIPKLVAALENGADLACGVRGDRQVPLFTRRGPSWIANQLVGRALGIRLADWGCGLNAVTGDIARRISAQDPLPTLPKIEAAMLSNRICQVPVAYSERTHGRSGYSIGRLARFSASFLKSFSISRALVRVLRFGDSHGNMQSKNNESSGVYKFAQISQLPVAIFAWAILSCAALFAKSWFLVSGWISKPEHFRIRRLHG